MTEQQDGRVTGEVKWFNNTKGYGFIVCETRPELGDLFAHYSAIEMDGYKTLKAGQRVSFIVSEGPKGLHAAAILSDEPAADPETPSAETTTDAPSSAAVDGIDVELPGDDVSGGNDRATEQPLDQESLRQSR